MASPVMLDTPPAQPPAIQAGGPAGGGPPTAGIGNMLADKAKQGMEGKGMIVTMYEAVKKVLQRMSDMSPEFAPFAARMMAVGDSGLEQMSQGKGGVQSESPATPSPTAASAPGGVGPGGGFPG